MVFKPGHKKLGGRKKGTPNKRTLFAQETAERLGVNPFEILLHIANGDKKALKLKTKGPIGLSARRAAAVAACQYIVPKRRAVAHLGPGGELLEEELRKMDELKDLSDQELAELAEKLVEGLKARKPENGGDASYLFTMFVIVLFVWEELEIHALRRRIRSLERQALVLPSRRAK